MSNNPNGCPRTPLEKRFWRRVQKTEGCWIWTGGKRRRGYGQIGRGGRGGQNVPAHRVAFELNIGPIPDGMCVLHKCDNPSCVRPDHLFLGTNLDNTADMIAKGRDRLGEGVDPARRPRGERHPQHKLTETQVREIRSSLATSTARQLATRFQVAKRTIYAIIYGETWAHLLTPSKS